MKYVPKEHLINIFTGSQSWNRQHHGKTTHPHRKVDFNEFVQNSLRCDTKYTSSKIEILNNIGIWIFILNFKVNLVGFLPKKLEK